MVDGWIHTFHGRRPTDVNPTGFPSLIGCLSSQQLISFTWAVFLDPKFYTHKLWKISHELWMLPPVTLNYRVTMNAMVVVVINFQKCDQCPKDHKSLGSLFQGVLSISSLSLLPLASLSSLSPLSSLSVFVRLCLCLWSFVGQVMSLHHSLCALLWMCLSLSLSLSLSFLLVMSPYCSYQML